MVEEKSQYQWYIVQAHSNFEKQVMKYLLEHSSLRGIDDKIAEVLVPVENIIKIKGGKKLQSERKIFPGYVLINCILTDEVYHFIKNTPKVINFLGGYQKPLPISEEEVTKIKQQALDSANDKPTISFEVGEEVKVADGPFTSFNGLIEEVDELRERLKLTVSIFGRATPVELEYKQVEKI